MLGSSSNNSAEDLTAFLGEGTEFKGVLSFTETVRIDGKFEGEIISKDNLIIGETAVINADISVGTIIAKGEIKGNIIAEKKIDIRADSKIFGNIRTTALLIEEGAIFEGKCEMITKGENSKKDSHYNNINKNEEDRILEEVEALKI